jgi:photosystem II stability/assembly factor-like uncharacterized protein
MKKLLLLSTFAFGLLSFSLAQQYGWTDLSANVPGTPNLTDVFFVSDDEGWIVSNYPDPIIYHTTDGGATFEVQTTQYTCNAIHMLNANEGYAGGASGFIYKTTDGGEHWNFYGTTVSNLADISFPPNGDTGYCCGINGNIWSIDNTGVTKMTSNINGDLSSISFPVNSEEGWVCGGDVIRHYDNNVWNGDQDYPSGGYNAIYMVDTLKGWAVGDEGIIIHTSDGQNWFEQENQQENSLFDVYFLDLNNGWAIGSGGTIVHTNNGGENWIVAGAGLTSNSLTGVHFTSPTNGYVVGNGKTLLKYTEVSGIADGVETMPFEIYPNPAKDKFTVQGLKFKVGYATFEIYDMNDRKLLEKQIPKGSETVEVDVSSLQSGIYFCRLISENKSTTQKLIIQK